MYNLHQGSDNMFQILSTDKLIDYCKSFNWIRTIKQLHVHHCYSPSHKDYNGSNGMKLQEAMERYHVQTRRWQALGQHLTLLPDGLWITGRDFNLDPASITGWNKGAFAIEMIGNFDKGHDVFKDPQAKEMFKFCAFLCQFKGLNIDKDVKFHRDSVTAFKTCPGTSIDRTWFMQTLKSYSKPTAQELVEYAHGKILEDEAKWLKKALADSDIYYLLLKFKNREEGRK
jgi:hypothetical protein